MKMDTLINNIIRKRPSRKNPLIASEKVIREYNDIGFVTYKISKRAKNIRLSINIKGEVKLTFPQRVSIRKAEEFLLLKIDWILRQKRLMKNKLETKLKLVNEDCEALESKGDVSNTCFNKVFAKVNLINRTRHLADTHSFTINKITIRKQKTLWGSCSGRNNISLNINLAKLPQELIDYVIIHELVHTIHKNHSNRFWNCVAEYMPEYKAHDKNLKKYSVLLLQ